LSPAVRSFIEERLLTASGHRDSIAVEVALQTPGIGEEALAQLVHGRLVRIEEQGGLRRIELTHDLLTGVIAERRQVRTQKATERLLDDRKEQLDRLVQQNRLLARRNRLLTAVIVILSIALIAALWLR